MCRWGEAEANSSQVCGRHRLPSQGRREGTHSASQTLRAKAPCYEQRIWASSKGDRQAARKLSPLERKESQANEGKKGSRKRTWGRGQTAPGPGRLDSQEMSDSGDQRGTSLALPSSARLARRVSRLHKRENVSFVLGVSATSI